MELRKFLGVKNTTSAERLRPGHLEAADNVDIDDTGRVVTRPGVALAGALNGSYHSLWADGDMCLFVDASNDLRRLNRDYSATTLDRLTAGAPASYNRQQNTVYFSNGVDSGRVANGALLNWGIQPPVNQPVASAVGGTLPPARYRYALTFRRADRTESGTGVAGEIELSETGGIVFTSIESSSDPEVVDKCIYLSGPNGEELFRALVVPNSAATGYVYELRQTIRLETQFDNPPPAGDIVECYNGVMFVVRGSVAWYSKPYAFERFCNRDQFLQFPGEVTLFAAVNDGIYVGTGETVWFISGSNPREYKSEVVFDYGAIKGTQAKTTMGVIKALEEEAEGSGSTTAAMWATPRGICFGMEGGKAINMTERDFSLPSTPRGAAIVRQAEGYTQYLVALEGATTAASDASR